MNELALFAGAGGGILGGKLLGWRTVCAVEWEPYAACVLAARQNDKILPPFPIWDDVQTFDGKPWRGIVDVVSGGFPCQDISAAGKGAGIDGERSGMWKEMARIVSEVRPRFVFVENSPMLTSRGLGTVLGDLASLGFDAEWGVISAADTGAPHLRERIWILGSDTSSQRWNIGSSDWEKRQLLHNFNGDASKNQSERERRECWVGKIGTDVANASNIGLETTRTSKQTTRIAEGGENVAYTSKQGLQGKFGKKFEGIGMRFADQSWWAVEPNVGRVADGVAARVDRLKAIGNGQVPRVAATAFELLSETN